MEQHHVQVWQKFLPSTFDHGQEMPWSRRAMPLYRCPAVAGVKTGRNPYHSNESRISLVLVNSFSHRASTHRRSSLPDRVARLQPRL